MQLARDLETRLAHEESAFRQALLREDLARLATLESALACAADRSAFEAEGLMIGWTPGDMRTFELKPAILDLLRAIWAEAREGGDPAAVRDAWAALDRLRLDRLVGCLARVPAPE
jgi:hypothetical protein